MKCGEWSGSLNCGCCDTVGVHCDRKKGHKGKCRGFFYDDYEIRWKTKTEQVKKTALRSTAND